MTLAALALAMALLMLPATAHRRAESLKLLAPGRRRIPVVPCAVVTGLLLTVSLPAGVVAAAAVVAVTVAARWRRHANQARRASESTELQGALEVLVSELRVGAHPVSAFEVAAGEVTGLVAATLRAVAARARLGGDVAAGLRSVAGRSVLRAHWERLAVCWQLAETHGLAIATLAQAAQRDIVERERFSARVNSALAGARTTAAVLAGLPVLGIALGQLIGADPVGFLLSGGAGSWLLAAGVTLACAGLVWSDRIIARVVT